MPLEENYYDDATMAKVHDACHAAGLDLEASTDLISAMQNRGILFRERPISVNVKSSDENTPDPDESNLVKHARRELELIGEDQDVIDWFLHTVRAFAAYGHSGGSASATIPVLKKLLQFENLSELTDDPEEWIHHDAETWGETGGIWQNKRNSKMFSKDQGRTYFSVSETGSVKYTHPKSMEHPRRPKIEGRLL